MADTTSVLPNYFVQAQLNYVFQVQYHGNENEHAKVLFWEDYSIYSVFNIPYQYPIPFAKGIHVLKVVCLYQDFILNSAVFLRQVCITAYLKGHSNITSA